MGLGFNPERAISSIRTNVDWVNWKGQALSPSTSAPSAEAVASTSPPGFHLNLLQFRNPACFVAGGIHSALEAWEKLIPEHLSEEQRRWVKNGVDIRPFFRHLRENLGGTSMSAHSQNN